MLNQNPAAEIPLSKVSAHQAKRDFRSTEIRNGDSKMVSAKERNAAMITPAWGSLVKSEGSESMAQMPSQICQP